MSTTTDRWSDERPRLSPCPKLPTVRIRFDLAAAAASAALPSCAHVGAEYEWGVRVAGFAAKLSLSPEQVADSTRPPIDERLWSSRQQLLLRLVDSLHASYRIHDALRAELAAEFREEHLIVLLMLAGQYHPISMMVNALQLAPEPLAPRFPQ